jgi:hypothetical protein
MASRVAPFVAAVVLGLGMTFVAEAQTAGVISGIVQDRTGQPVSGAVLTISDPARPVTRVVVTDLQGGYFVDHLHYGTAYDVDITHPRFRKSRLHTMANEGNIPVHIALEPRRSRLATIGHACLRVLRLGL